jgi:hypothetical protein
MLQGCFNFVSNREQPTPQVVFRLLGLCFGVTVVPCQHFSPGDSLGSISGSWTTRYNLYHRPGRFLLESHEHPLQALSSKARLASILGS